MAEVISDFITDSSHFHHRTTMMNGSGQQLSPAGSPYRQSSRSRPEPPPAPSPRPQEALVTGPASSPNNSARGIHQEEEDVIERPQSAKVEPPSPPPSSSPTPGAYVKKEYPSQKNFPLQSGSESHSQQPSYSAKHESEDAKAEGDIKESSSLSPDIPIKRSARSLDDVKKYSSNTIKVRDLAHIQSFTNEELSSFGKQSDRLATGEDTTLKYEISGMPITDIIEMVAGLLTKITTTNDRQHDNLHRSMPSGDASNLSGQASSVLAFHGKNVPSITILSYLSRIHKYCPTTYEVFLSLLVYFDRMTERVNAVPVSALRGDVDVEADSDSRPSTSYSADGSDLADSPPSGARSMPESVAELEKAQYTNAPRERDVPFPLSHFFVVDSFNIHRLVIAGVTCASKFFSDVFYTNSRYAKVGLAFSLISYWNPLMLHEGRRSSSRRTQPSRTPIPSPKRLPTLSSR